MRAHAATLCPCHDNEPGDTIIRSVSPDTGAHRPQPPGGLSRRVRAGEERDGLFLIKHIGRSDGDLRSTLKAQVESRYSLFKFRYALSALDAFGKECELYHFVVTLHDPIHPVAPPGTNAACSRCRQHSRAASA